MRLVTLLACLALVAVPLCAHANEKAKAQGLLDASRAATEAFAKRNDGNKLVADDVDAARSWLKKAGDAFAGGSTMFGLGDLSQESGLDVKFDTGMADLYLALGQSRLDKEKAAGELALLNEQVAKMKAKVKVFDDRKAELERLRAEVAKFAATAKELAAAKEEIARLNERGSQLESERKALNQEIERLKNDVAMREAALAAAVAQSQPQGMAPGGPVPAPAAPAAPAAAAPPATPAAPAAPATPADPAPPAAPGGAKP